MLLHDSAWAPNPRRVRMFLAEKGISVPIRSVDLRGGEQFSADYRAINPRGTVPALEMDDGELLTESVAICRYFEAHQPEPPLFGTDPRSIARIESWTRRIEAEGYAAGVYRFRNGNPAFADRALPGAWPPIPQIPELAERGAIMWTCFIAMLNDRLAETPWVAGGDFSFADITAFVTIDFAGRAHLSVPDEMLDIRRWLDMVRARPSAAA